MTAAKAETLEDAYARLMGGRKHARATPSRSFVAVLRALLYLGRSYNYKISQHACVDQQYTGEILARMQRDGLAKPSPSVLELPAPGRGRIYFELTEAGRWLAGLPSKGTK